MSQGINAAYGLQPVQSLVGNGTANKLQAYRIYSDPDTGQTSTTFGFSSGDAVKFAPQADADKGFIVPMFLNAETHNLNILIGDAADPILGVFNSCMYTGIDGIEKTSSHFAAGTQTLPGSEVWALVNDDPMAVFKIQVSDSTGLDSTGIFLNNMVGSNASIVSGGVAFTAGNITVPKFAGGNASGYYLDLHTVAATAGLDLKIIGIARSIFNKDVDPLTNLNLTAGVDMPFIDVYIKINRHIYSAPVGTSA